MRPLFFVLAGIVGAGWGGAALAGPPQTSASGKTPANAVAPDLTGKVVNAKGEPLPGATVYIYTAQERSGPSAFCPSCYPDCGKRQATDARGAFRIKALSPALIFRVLVVREGYDPIFVPNVDPKHGPIRAALTLRKSAGDPARLISGRVVDDLDKAIVGAAVEPCGIETAGSGMYGEIPDVEPLAITDETGAFRFHCPKPDTTLYVKVSARGFAPVKINDLKSGGSPSRALHMTRGATVTGTFRDAAGKPITDAAIQIVHADRNAPVFLGWFEIGTDKSGKFSLLNLPPNKEFWVTARMDGLTGKGVAAGRTKIATGADGTTTAPVALVASPAVTVSGRVVLSDGKSVPPGTFLMLGRCETWDIVQYPLKADGKFVFPNAPKDDLTLDIYIPGYIYAPNKPHYPTETGWHLKPSAPTENITITLTPEKPQSANSGN